MNASSVLQNYEMILFSSARGSGISMFLSLLTWLRARATKNKDGSPRLTKPQPVPEPLKHAVMEKQFLEETGITIEEHNQNNLLDYYAKEILKIHILSKKASFRTLADRFDLDLKPLRRNGLILGKRCTLRFSPVVYEKLGLPQQG